MMNPSAFPVMDAGSDTLDASFIQRNDSRRRLFMGEGVPTEVDVRGVAGPQAVSPGTVAASVALADATLKGLDDLAGKVAQPFNDTIRGAESAAIDLTAFPLMAGIGVGAAIRNSPTMEALFGVKADPELAASIEGFAAEGMAQAKEALLGAPTPGSEQVEKVLNLPFLPLSYAAEKAEGFVTEKTGDPLAGKLAGLVAMVATGKAMHVAAKEGVKGYKGVQVLGLKEGLKAYADSLGERIPAPVREAMDALITAEGGERLYFSGGPGSEQIVTAGKALLGKGKGEGGPPPGDGTLPDGRNLKDGTGTPNPVGPDLSKLGLTDADKAALKSQVKEHWNAIDEARRGTRSFEQAYTEANRLIDSGEFTFQQFLKHPVGENWKTPEHGIAARIFEASATQRRNATLDAFDRGEVPAEQVALANAESLAANLAAYGGTAETGRSLAYYNMGVEGKEGALRTPKESIAVADFARKLEESGVDPVTVARRLRALTPAQLRRLAEGLTPPGAGDMLTELWYGALLSNPATHTANVLSNTIVLFNSVQEREQAAKAGQTINAVRRALGMDERRGVEAGEGHAMLQGLVESFADALRASVRAARTGESSFGEGKMEKREGPAVTVENLKHLGNRIAQGLGSKEGPFDPDTIGTLGHAFDYIFTAFPQGPTRGLLAGDEFFKATNYRMEIAAQAWRRARLGEGEGKTVADRYQSLKDNPTEAMRAEAQRSAAYQTYTDQGGKFTQGVLSLRDSHPLTRIVLPFVKTPSRVAHYTFQRMPVLNLLSGELRRDLLGPDPVRRDLAAAKLGTSAMAAATAASLVAAGAITGGGPRDPKMRELLKATGWQPYSLKVGGRYVSYDRFDPIGGMLGAVADFVEIRGSINAEDNDTELESVPIAIVLGFTRAFTNKTYLTGFSNAVDAITEPDKAGMRWAKSFAGSFVPAGVASVNRNVFDNYLREVNGTLEQIKSRTPGFSTSLPPMRDPWGRPSLNHGYALGILLPVRQGKEIDDPAAKELLTLGISVPRMPKTFDGPSPAMPESFQRYFDKGPQAHGIAWTPDEYDQLARLYGNELRIDWETGKIGRADEKAPGYGMHDFLNGIVTDKIPLPRPMPLPGGGEATLYSQLPESRLGTPGEEMRADVLRVIMRSYKKAAEGYYLNYQHAEAQSKGKKSMLMLKIEREGAKGVRKGMAPADASEAVRNATRGLEGLTLGQ